MSMSQRSRSVSRIPSAQNTPSRHYSQTTTTTTTSSSSHRDPADPTTTYHHLKHSYEASGEHTDSSSEDERDPRWARPRLNNQQHSRLGEPSSSFSNSFSNSTSSSSSSSSIYPTTTTSPASIRHSFSVGGHTHTANNNNMPASLNDVNASHINSSTTQPAPLAGVSVPTASLEGLSHEQKELFEYYRARIAAFEQERVEFLLRLDEMAGTSKEKHRLKWELHKKNEQIMDLQKALSDAHVFLYDERAQVLKLTAENDRLRIEDLENKQRLEHLLSLTQPVSQEVVLFRECRPEKLTRNFPKNREGIYKGQMDLSSLEAVPNEPRTQVLAPQGSKAAVTTPTAAGGGGAASARLSSSTSSHASSSTKHTTTGSTTARKTTGKVQPVVRTIYLPNENVEILKQIIQSLRTQLQEQHDLFEQRVSALQEDRAIREAEIKDLTQRTNGHLEEIHRELREANELNKMTTKDYLELRHAAQESEKKHKEKLYHVSRAYNNLQKYMDSMLNRSKLEEGEVKKQHEHTLNLFRQQTANTEEDLAILKSQYLSTQTLYEKRIRYLEQRLKTVKQKCLQVEKRRKLELEGYTNDIRILRTQVRRLEHHSLQHKLQHAHPHAHAHTLAASKGATSYASTAEEKESSHYPSRGVPLYAETHGAADEEDLYDEEETGAGGDGDGGGGGGLHPLQQHKAHFQQKVASIDSSVSQLKHELEAMARKLSLS